MSLNVGNRQVRPGLWTSDLFECCLEPTSFCEALFCPWCLVSAMYNRFTRNNIGVDELCCLSMCMLDFCCTCGLSVCCSSHRYRTEIQRRFGIVQNDCADCLATCLCLSCAISQQYREMCYRNFYPGGCCVSPPIGAPMIVQTTTVVTMQQVPQQPPGYPPQHPYTPATPGPVNGVVMQQPYGYPQPQHQQQPYGYAQPQHQPQPAYGYPPQQQAYPSQPAGYPYPAQQHYQPTPSYVQTQFPQRPHEY